MAKINNISDKHAWSNLPQPLLLNYGQYGGGFIEVWYVEYAMQNFPKSNRRITYNRPQDAIQVELGGTAIYQNIMRNQGGSMEFFKKNEKKLRPIGGHDIDMLVLNENKLTGFLKSLGYKPHADRNQKFWYCQRQDPNTQVWIGAQSKRGSSIFTNGAPTIQYDLFRNNNVLNLDLTGCEKKLKPIKAYGITKWNLCDEDLLLTKAKIYDNEGVLHMGGPRSRAPPRYALRPKDLTDVFNLIASADPKQFDYAYFVDRLELNMLSEGKSSKGRKVGQIDSGTPWQERSLDQRIMTLFKTMYNKAAKNELQDWIVQELDWVGDKRENLMKKWVKEGYVKSFRVPVNQQQKPNGKAQIAGSKQTKAQNANKNPKTKLTHDLYGLLYSWQDIEAKFVEVGKGIIDEVDSRH